MCYGYGVEDGNRALRHVHDEHVSTHPRSDCVCGTPNANQEQLLRHIQRLHITYFYVCITCGTVSNVLQFMETHIRQH